MNQRSMRTSWCPLYIVIIVLLYMPAWALAAGQASGEEGIADQVDAAIRHAETYYLLSVTEQGDVPAFQAGLRELEHAEEMLKQGTLPPEEVDRLSRHIKALKSDLQDRIEMMRWTLEGVFPLTGFLTSSLFTDSGPTAVYRLIDDPAIKATRSAAADLVARATELEKKQAPLPVVFTCVSREKLRPARRSKRKTTTWTASGPGLWSTRRVKCSADRRSFRCKRMPRSRMHSPPQEKRRRTGSRRFPGRPASQPRLRRSCYGPFGPRVLVVVIRQADVIGDVHFYRMEGRILEAGKPRQEAFSTSGFGRDRRDRLAWILWANAALLAIAYAAYALIVHTHRAMAGGIMDRASPAAIGCFCRGAHSAIRGFPAAGIDTAPTGNAGTGFLLDCVSGRAGFSRRTAGRPTGWPRPGSPNCGQASVRGIAAAPCSQRWERVSPRTLPAPCCCTRKSIR